MRFALALLALSTSSFAFAQDAAPPPPAAAAATAPLPWLYRGSDIPPDASWTFGELPNGLRYAVRKSGVPPKQISIRVAIDAGGMMEEAGERGFAHFNEHLAFRGSAYIGDGEAKRVWQRLGATFGSDTNATTGPTQTVYKLDLPSATPESANESLHILSGMIAAPDIKPGAVETEKRTILAELREGAGPGQRIGEGVRATLYAGQRLGDASNSKEQASVAAATPHTLRVFHDRWYRPANTLVVVVGDMEPDVLEGLVKRNFSSWRPSIQQAGNVSFGQPQANAPRARVVVEPGVPTSVILGVMRPWQVKADTVAYNRDKQSLELAARLISRRLETRARAGGSFLQAAVDYSDVLRSTNSTIIEITPVGSDWRRAVRDVRAVIADALTRPPTQAEIAREIEDYKSNLDASVETETGQDDREIADTLVEAVNIRETVASASVARDVFLGQSEALTPAALLKATRRIFAGTPLRAVLTLPAADPAAQARLLTAITEPVAPVRVDTAKAVSMDALPKLGAPATVTGRSTLAPLPFERISLSNGSTLIVFPNDAEKNKIYVSARWGGGRAAFPADKPNPSWAADYALVAGGIGDLGLDALDRLTNGRRLGLDFDLSDDAFVFKATTGPADLHDQLRLIAAKLQYPRFDAAPVLRARAATLAGYDTADTTAMGVVQRALPGWLRGGDPRWSAPTKDQIATLTPEAFEAFWKPLIAAGPVEISIYGDTTTEAAIAATLDTVGALPVRAPVTLPQPAPHGPAPGSTLELTHRGPADQAAAVLAWPTGAGRSDLFESRRLDVLAAVFTDRMFDALREADGESYSPNVNSNWPTGLASGGSFVVISQVRPGSVPVFFQVAEKIAHDLATAPVSDDELTRALGPMKQMYSRAATGNMFWLGQLSGVSGDGTRVANVLSLTSDFARITAADLQASAAKWLVDGQASRMVVRPVK
ncbi:Peptidase M16 [Sphingomonas antarctica]|uniref:M16 family metallopeptidase n=1 Tax=Sphingomonas antarctica TaxID=2040274 RepID=UPI0039EAFE08